MTDTSIEWCRRPGTRAKTWNPTNGCKEVSPGCTHCYAKVFASRFSGPGQRYEGLVERRGKGRMPMWTGDLRFERNMLDAPLHWRDPCTVFVNSMSDLFMFPKEQIAAVFGVMAACPRHTFIILTKRDWEMPRWFEWVDGPLHCIQHALMTLIGDTLAQRTLTSVGADGRVPWPLPNVWIGVTCEDRRHGLPRLDNLRRTPAAVRVVSFEPLLEDLGEVDLSGIGWAIAGAESIGSRRCDAAWLRSLRDKCAVHGVPYFLKQAREENDGGGRPVVGSGPGSHRKPRGIIGLPYLDGVQHAAFPEVT